MISSTRFLRPIKPIKRAALALLCRVTGYDAPLLDYCLRVILPDGMGRLLGNFFFYTPIIRLQYWRLGKLHSVNSGASRARPEPSVEARRIQNQASVNHAIPKGGMLKVLFITDKWLAGTPESSNLGSSMEWSSLEESGLATQENVYVDEYFYQHRRRADMMILERCMLFKPDCVISAVFATHHLTPKYETFALIKKMGIPIVAIVSDTVQGFSVPRPFYHFTHAPECNYPFADLYLENDTTTAHLTKTKRPEKYLCIPGIMRDSRLFSASKLDRDIDISFVGNLNRPWRQEAFEALNEADIQVYTRDSFRVEKNLDKVTYLTTGDYINILQRSRIVLNFPFNIMCGKPLFQGMKGRVVEAAKCGAMVLETESPDTRMWLDPFVDYVPYTTLADLVDKAKYYLEHETERAAIALSGYKKFTEQYSSHNLWKAVFEKLGLL